MEEEYLKEELSKLVKFDDAVSYFFNENCLDGLWYWNLENNNFWISPKFLSSLGYDKEYVSDNVIQKIQEIIDPEDLAKSTEEHQKHFADPNYPFKVLVRYKCKNGSVVWIRTYGQAIRDKDGKPIRFIGNHYNVTENIKNQNELILANQRLNKIFNNLADLVFVLDKNFIYTEYYNHDNESKSFVSSEFFLNKKITDIPFPKDILDLFINSLEKVKSTKTKQYIEYSLQMDNICNWFEMIISPVIDSNYDIIEFICIVNNVSEHKILEQKHKNMFNSSTHGIVYQDINGRISNANPAALKILGLELKELKSRMPNSSKWNCIKENGEAFLPIESPTKKAIETGKTVENVVMGIYNELINAFVWVKISCVPILDVNKKPYMVYILFEDITESRAIQIELIKEKKRVEEANKVKNEFLNNMSHELRTPLNGIMGFSDLLLKTNLTNEQKDYIKAISNSSNALLDLINDILNFSKIETGNIQLDIVKTNLLETCEQLIDILSYKAIEKSLDLYLNFSPLLPEYVWMDVVKFKQIMLNLLGNAIKFTNEGEIHIYVSCIKEDIDKARITFSITDTGIGISELNRKKIFDAFSQEDGSSTRKHGGTGLGLTISNKLLELMDSKLDFKTQLEQGSSFYFTLDLKSEFSNAHNFINSNINNILIIDKNQENKGIIQNIFYDISPNITFISDSFDLISNIDFKKYDLLIIEHRIRSFNSIEIIDRIRNELNIPDEKLKIVLLYSPLDIGILNNQEKGLIFTKIQKPIKHSYFNLNLLNTTCETINKGYLDLKDVYKKVLVAEDNPINMLLTKKILKSLFPQVEIIEARNGREAVKLFASNKPDIVYMDLQMPEMNGYEATTEIRKTEFHKNTPIIALTADVIEGTREACLEKGMNDYISKPVIMEIIKESYIKWINRGIIP